MNRVMLKCFRVQSKFILDKFKINFLMIQFLKKYVQVSIYDCFYVVKYFITEWHRLLSIWKKIWIAHGNFIFYEE